MSKEEEEKEEFSHIEEGEKGTMRGDGYNVYFHMWTVSHTEAQTHRHTDTHACEQMLGAGRELLVMKKGNKRRQWGNKHKQSALIFCMKTMSDLLFCMLICYFLINKQSRVENKAVSK